MRVVIIGAGEVGVHIARQLIAEGKDVAIIEKKPEVAKRTDSSLDAIVITGEGTSIETLKDAGIEDSSVFIAATSSDEINLISCFIVASEFNVGKKIARVGNMEYTKTRTFTSKVSGVDYLVNTEREAAWEIYQTLEQGANSSIITFDNPDVQIRELDVTEDSIMNGTSVKLLRSKLEEEFVIAGIIRGGELLIPHGDFVLKTGDTIYMASLVKTFYKIYKKIGDETHKMRKIAILGATPIGVAVADLLSTKGRSVILIDRDYNRCKECAENLPSVTVLNGDISEPEIHEDEQISKADAIVTTTMNEELNIVSGVYAKTLGVKRAIAVVEKTNYMKLAGDIGIDSTVSKKFCAVNSIIKTIRKGRVRSVHAMFDGNAEALEVVLQPNSPLTGIPIRELVIPENSLLLSIQRDKKTYIPTGDMELKANDNIIVFLLRSDIAAFEKLLV